MQNKNLKKQKIKLTIFFSILVFLLAIFLESIFFGFKYFNEKNKDEKIFLRQTEIIFKKFDTQKDILDVFSNSFLDDNLWDFNEKKLKNIEKITWKKINFFLLNKNNEIIEKNIIENIDFKIFNNLENKKFYSEKDFFILEKKLKNHILWEKIIFYKKYRYSTTKLLEDLLLFIFITLLSTVIFYIFWKKFVSKILKPVEKNIFDMENFIQNASHEFKTPLAIIHSNLQLLKAESKLWICDKELINNNILEVNNFNNLIDWLTELSWINANLKKIKIDLKKEIPEIVAENIKTIKNKKIKLGYNFEKNIKILANKEHFKILFQNLLQNSIKYSKVDLSKKTKKSEIKVILNKNKLIISDNWIWIKEKNISKIFDRFYRENNSKTWNWFWIWLSLVARICEINNWKIKVKSKKGVWTSFEIKF